MAMEKACKGKQVPGEAYTGAEVFIRRMWAVLVF